MDFKRHACACKRTRGKYHKIRTNTYIKLQWGSLRERSTQWSRL